MKITFFLFFFISYSIIAQDKKPSKDEQYFEGILHYRYDQTDLKGNKIPFPIFEDVECRDKNHIVNKVIYEENLAMLGHKDIYLNSETSEAYQIDHDNKIIKKIYKGETEVISPLEYKKIGEEKFMNYLCEIYFIKYVHKMEYMKSYIDTSKPDTLSCTYYIAKDLKVSNSEIFARLQGNHNSKFLDGRFSGIALKVIVKKSSGIKIIIEATKVEKKNVQDIIKFPDYPLQK